MVQFGPVDRHDMKDVEAWIERLRSCEALEEREVKQLCARATEIFVEEGNVQRVDAPVTLCGDIHGQVRRTERRSTKGNVHVRQWRWEETSAAELS